MDQKYQAQRQSPLVLSNQSFQQPSKYSQKNAEDSQYEGNENSPVSRKRNQIVIPRQASALSSQEIASKYSNFLQSTKSGTRASGNSLKRSYPHNLGEISSLAFSHKMALFEETSPLHSQQENIKPQVPPLGPINQSSRQNILSSSRSSANLNDMDYAQSGEFNMQFSKKLGQLEMELKKEANKTQNLDVENKNLREQLQVAQKEAMELHRAIDQLSRAPDITLKILAEESGADERKLKQIVEKTEIESKLSKECDRLIGIIDDKESQINQWMERFISLKENKEQLSLQRNSELEKQIALIRQQLETERADARQIFELNANLQSQLEDYVQENERLNMNCQMQQEEVRQNHQMMQEQTQQNQLVLRDQNIKKEELETLVRTFQATKEELEQSLSEQNRVLQETRAQIQEKEKQWINQKSVFEERISEYVEVLNDVKAQLDEQIHENTQTKKEFEGVKQDLLAKNEQLNKQLQEKQIKLQEYSRQIEEQKVESQEQQRQITELQREFSKSVGETKAHECESLRLRTRISEIQEELQVTRSESHRLLDQIGQLQLRYEQINSEKDEILTADKDYRKETKKQIAENERKTFLVENQLKILEKQVLIYKEKIADSDHQITSILKEKHENATAHQQQLCNLRNQIQNIKSTNETERGESDKRHEEELSKKQKQIDEMQIQIRQVKEKQDSESKAKEMLMEEISTLQKQLAAQTTNAKESEKRQLDRVQEAVSKTTRDLRDREQEVKFFERENANLNRILTQQKKAIYILHNKTVQLDASVQSEEEELLLQLGLGELISARRIQERQSFNPSDLSATNNIANNNNNSHAAGEISASNKFSFACSTKNSHQSDQQNYQNDDEEQQQLFEIRRQYQKQQEQLYQQQQQKFQFLREEEQGYSQEDESIRESARFSVNDHAAAAYDSEVQTDSEEFHIL